MLKFKVISKLNVLKHSASGTQCVQMFKKSSKANQRQEQYLVPEWFRGLRYEACGAQLCLA